MTEYAYDVPEPELIRLNLSGEVFEMLPIGGLDWRDFVREIAKPDATDPAEKMRQDAAQAEMVFSIFETHMEAAEYERFAKFAKARGLKLQLLLKIIEDVVSGSAERPTEPPSPSGHGWPTTGDGSTAAASSPAST